MKKLIIIDGSGLIYRSFYAVPPFMRSPSGEQTNAVFGFVNILFALLANFKPDYISIAFDKKGPTVRHEQYKEYKATRVKAPDELYAQIPMVKELVADFKIPSFEVQGFEADDIIATICKNYGSRDDLDIHVATGDFDLFQLISPRVSILYPTKGFKEAQLISAKEVQEKYGIRPDQIADYKALCGDSSDNIPGVAGIGPKTAVTLLNKYDTLDTIYKNIDTVTPEGCKAKLILNRENAYLSKMLATLISDVAVEFNLDAAHTHAFDVPGLERAFEKLGFKNFKKRIGELFGDVPASEPLTPPEEKPTSQTSLF